MCLFAKEIVVLPLGELEGNRENSSSWAGKRDCGCLLLIIIFVENGGKAKYCRVLARLLARILARYIGIHEDCDIQEEGDNESSISEISDSSSNVPLKMQSHTTGRPKYVKRARR